MTAGKVASPAPAPPPTTKTDADLNILCEKIRKEASLTPPGIVDALCEDKRVYVRCNKAIFMEELREFAHMIGRNHLLLFDSDC